MQDVRRQISPIELELERVRKFSIIDCIRDEIRDVVDKLPKTSEAHFQKKIDGVIRRNLLKERKVRFGSTNDKREEPGKDALEEIDMILQVLGNDKNNKLVIENFDILEKRIKSVEQRLSGLLRNVPDLGHADKKAVKIDPQRVKTNIQDFVNMFNHVFTSTYEVLTNTNSSLLDETMSSKNRLKFHLLAHLTELKESESDVQIRTKNYANANDNSTTKSGKNKLCSKGPLNKSESKIEVPVVKAVDSLITLRQRFKAQSAKWKQMKLNKKANDVEDKAKRLQSKKLVDLNPKRKEDLKPTKKNISEPSSQSDAVNENQYFDIMEDLLDLNYIENAINESLRRNVRDTKENDKKNENKTIKRKTLLSGCQKLKDVSPELALPDTTELIRSYVNKTVLRKTNVVPNPKERLSKLPPRYSSANKLDTQNDIRKGKLSKITNKYTSAPKIETLYEKYPSRLGAGLKTNNQSMSAKDKIPQSKSKYNIAFKFDPLDELLEENMAKRTSTLTNVLEQEELPKQNTPATEMTDSSDTIIPLYKRESLVDESGNSTSVINSEEIISKQPEECTEKLLKGHEKEIGFKENISETLVTTSIQNTLAKYTDIENSCTLNSKELLKDHEILNCIIADIADNLSKPNKTNNNVVCTIKESKEEISKETKETTGIKEESSNEIKIIKEESPKESKATTEKEKLSKNSKVSSTINSAETKEKLKEKPQKRNTITILQLRERQSKDAKKLDKNKTKDIIPRSKDTNVPKSIKTKLNTFRREQQPSLCKQRTEYKTFISSMLKGSDSKTSGSSIEVVLKKSSNTSTDTFSKTSLSLLSELKLQPNKTTRFKITHQKT